MYPARTSSEMLIWAPICWATPSTTPPSRVPHREPSPPITTAANANSRIVSVPVVGDELGVHAVGDAGQRHGAERERRRDAEHVPVVGPGQLRRLLVVGHGADQAAVPGRGQEVLQPEQHHHGDREDDHEQVADLDLRAERERAAHQGQPGADRAAVGGEELEQAVLDHHRQAEGDHQRGEHAAVERALEDRALQHVAEQRHHRHHDEEGPEHGDVGDGDDADRDVARDHREVAVREVDDLHHPEHQRQPAGEQRVEPAGQHPLDDGVHPGHYGSLPSPGWLAGRRRLASPK